jgi:hypothetical protein
MDIYRFAIPGGGEIEGAVQGSGGQLSEATSGLARLLAAQAQAAAGKPLAGIYEPMRGCVKVMPDHAAAGDGRPVVVALAGARISLVKR